MKDTDKIQLRSYQLNYQPRPQGFSLKKWVGREKAPFSRPTHFLREKPWGRGC